MKFLANGLNKRLALIIIGCLVGFTSCNDDEEVCTENTWYEDADGDGLGNPDDSQTACEQPDGYVANSDDDDEGIDTNPEIAQCDLAENLVEVYTTSDGIEFVRTPESCFDYLDSYNFNTNYADIEGLRMNYVDEGPADGDIVIMVHGEPSWSYLYRKMIPIIADAGYRVIVPDLIGMGRSDKPVDVAVHRFETHVRWWKQFVDHFQSDQITLFCQDWGSLISMRAVGDDASQYARIIVSNGAFINIPVGQNPFVYPDPVEIDPNTYPTFAEFNASPEASDFGSWLEWALTVPNFIASDIIEELTAVTLTPDQVASYDAPYPHFIYKAANRSFPAMVTDINGQNAQPWENLGLYTKPFLTLMGRLDQSQGSEANQNMWIDHVPGSEGQPHDHWDNAHHFIQEDVGEELAQKVVEFLMLNPL